LDNGAATFDPLLQFDTTELDVPGSGSHRIEVRDAGDIMMFTRMFEPMIAVTEIEEGEVDVLNLPYFSQLIPVQVGASRILVLDDFDTELGSIMLTGAAPTVTVDFAPGGAPLGGPLTVGWTIVDPDSPEHTVWVQYSNDNGLTWTTLLLSETETELRIDFDRLPGADGSAIIRVLATDGANSGFGDSASFSVAHKLPEVEIFFPADGTVFRRGELVWLQASVSDLDETSIDEAAITWTSNVDGILGQGEELPTISLGVGVHTITVTGTDTDGNVAEHSIVVIVEDSPLVEATAVINVPADHPTIQAAIDASLSGDEIIVAPGIYEEIIDFDGKGVTVRSTGGADVTIIDATNVADPGDGRPVVRCDSGEGPDAVLDGFTLTGGTGATSFEGIPSGGGMFIRDSSPTVANCKFIGNSAVRGGGMRTLFSSTILTGSIFSGNVASEGGAMANSFSSPDVRNCTFSKNMADFGGGFHNDESAFPTVTNCIFWMNSDLGGTDLSAQIHDDLSGGPAGATVNYSDVQGGAGLAGTGNISTDPQFMDADGPDNQVGTEDDDLRLQTGSPCIDSGDPAYVASPGETDLDGHDRILCDRVEMGAYEFAGDFACDQTIDLDDFANWDACMTGPDGGPYAPECATFDCDADSDIDMKDFAEFGIIFSP
jgi:hypothetical protein